MVAHSNIYLFIYQYSIGWRRSLADGCMCPATHGRQHLLDLISDCMGFSMYVRIELGSNRVYLGIGVVGINTTTTSRKLRWYRNVICSTNTLIYNIEAVKVQKHYRRHAIEPRKWYQHRAYPMRLWATSTACCIKCVPERTTSEPSRNCTEFSTHTQTLLVVRKTTFPPI